VVLKSYVMQSSVGVPDMLMGIRCLAFYQYNSSRPEMALKWSVFFGTIGPEKSRKSPDLYPDI